MQHTYGTYLLVTSFNDSDSGNWSKMPEKEIKKSGEKGIEGTERQIYVETDNAREGEIKKYRDRDII